MTAAGFPLADGQFWVVTLAAAAALAWLLRGVLPVPALRARRARRRGTRRVGLTIEGKGAKPRTSNDHPRPRS